MAGALPNGERRGSVDHGTLAGVVADVAHEVQLVLSVADGLELRAFGPQRAAFGFFRLRAATEHRHGRCPLGPAEDVTGDRVAPVRQEVLRHGALRAIGAGRQFQREAAQNVKMLPADGHVDEFHAVGQERSRHCPADDGPVIGAERHGVETQGILRAAMPGLVDAGGRGLAVVALDVLAMVTHAETAGITRQPRPIRAADAVKPAIPWRGHALPFHVRSPRNDDRAPT